MKEADTAGQFKREQKNMNIQCVLLAQFILFTFILLLLEVNLTLFNVTVYH